MNILIGVAIRVGSNKLLTCLPRISLLTAVNFLTDIDRRLFAFSSNTMIAAAFIAPVTILANVCLAVTGYELNVCPSDISDVKIEKLYQ